MTTLAQSAVVIAFMAALNAASTLAGVPVYRTRLRPLGQGTQRAVVVRKVTSDPQGGEILGAPIDWVTVVQVENYARGEPTQASDEASDDLLQLSHDVLVADPTLGGVVDNISDPSLSWDEDEKDPTVGCVIATYRVMHRTAYRSIGV